MSEAIDDGGSAFPHDEFTKDGNHFKCHSGMILLDWFAGMALANSAIAHSGIGEQDTSLVCYRQAIAMLNERERINAIKS